ncbi:hypothetical protein M011DRAFT_472593 [Sporormia fimetaria CBS 119925]|uniref:MutL C-terminal dimerisation domain-containing protein n=1 Tax=Sporormia fimetaria CBS 119925 TaxID=1340428 RepID=A0A6A6UVZ2_9PLEO|nr:hypothetical protein M011DRAFT_472593 [Sporormia fimetaria CBS 119925]
MHHTCPSTRASRNAHRIALLPADVASQLKSSATISSLSHVVLELLKNALDAGSTKVEGTVDFQRGDCTLEDDGLGITPSEFEDGGGLGRLYHTSKYYSEEPCLGRHGTFVASLAAVSLLTISSRRDGYRSTNSIVFHRSKPIERRLPALKRDEINGKHGTRVVVRNLFGHLPVRVKHRATLSSHSAELDRLWDCLKREVVALLLAWQHPVHVRLRDAGYQSVINLSTTDLLKDACERTPAKLQQMLSILTQADYLSVSDWPSWVPVSASTPTIAVQGAISLEPAPTTQTQFISLSHHPLSADGHNEFYGAVNRLFALSAFGFVEDEEEPDEKEKLRRAQDKRYKTEGHTHRQLRGRKGVDRHPMFHIRISLKNKGSVLPQLRALEGESNLQAVVDVLQAMVMQWLSVHHFRPRKLRTLRDTVVMSPITANRPEARQRVEGNEDTALLPMSSNAAKRKNKAPSHHDLVTRKHTQGSPFREWTRMKTSRAVDAPQATATKRSRPPSDDRTCSDRQSTISNTFSGSPANSDALQALPGIAELPGSLVESAAGMGSAGGEVDDSVDASTDATVDWTNPITQQTYSLNARTGCVLPKAERPRSALSGLDGSASAPQAKGLRLTKRARVNGDGENAWLNNLLGEWDNPIFKPVEQSIPQVVTEPPESNPSGSRYDHSSCQASHFHNNFDGASVPATTKLSRESLKDAIVLAQLDKKFILVKTTSGCGESGTQEILLLIDQHAADERVQVEALLARLCAPLPEGSIRCRSQLGHSPSVAFVALEKPVLFAVSKRERDLFVAHAARFAAWGILLDVCVAQEAVAAPRSRTSGELTVTVKTLPPAISERCKADSKLLISFLRKAVWEYADRRHATTATDGIPSGDTAGDTPRWITRLASCPQGLVDLVNSRACRSAIMFNDGLSMEQCRDLVDKLSVCALPFMCAHGRPSMVPLVTVGDLVFSGGSTPDVYGDDKGTEEGFISAWRKWKCR